MDIYLPEQATSYTETGPTCSAKTTSKKTPKPGVEVPTICFCNPGAQREATEAALRIGPVREELRTKSDWALRYTPVPLDIASKLSW